MKTFFVLMILCCASNLALLADTTIGPFGFGVGHVNGFPAATSAELQILIGPPALESTCASLGGSRLTTHHV